MSKNLQELRGVLRRLTTRGAKGLSTEDLVQLPCLYRWASSLVARLETSGEDRAQLAEARALLAQAHGALYREIDRSGAPLPVRLARFFADEVPRALRAEWRLLLLAFALVYGMAFLAWFAVRQDLELAYSLLDPGAVANEIQQLRELEPDEPFQGNFTFGREESSLVSGFVMGNNMQVAVRFFAAGLVPPLFLLMLATNGLMLGTYTAVAGHWGQAGAISSILWCHGVLEIQAIVFAGAAGLVLVRSWVAPGPWSRRHAMRLESRRALRLIAAAFPMLFFAGLIEGFVSPHASFGVRVATAIGTGVALVVWVGVGGRGRG